MKVSNGFKVYEFDRLYTACKMLGEYIKNNSEDQAEKKLEESNGPNS